jgi:membrane-associated phospholipid phosphatase
MGPMITCNSGRAAALLIAFAVAPGRLEAQDPPPDSAASSPQVPTGTEWPVLWLAGAAILVLPFDETITADLFDPEVQSDSRLKNVAAGFRWYGIPGTWLIAGSLYAAGRLGKEPGTARLGLRALEAILAAEAAGFAGKALAGRARPSVDPGDSFDFQLGRGMRRGDSYHSFPSTHTAAAFALAAAISEESRYCCGEFVRQLGPVLYGAAILVGASRLYEGRHWASDVLGGAAVGTLAGLRVVRYHRDHPGGWLDHWLLPRAAARAGAGTVLVWALPLE